MSSETTSGAPAPKSSVAAPPASLPTPAPEGFTYVMINPAKVDKEGHGPIMTDFDTGDRSKEGNQTHPLVQPNDPNAPGKPGAKPALAWAQQIGEPPHDYVELAVVVGRIVLVRESQGVLQALQAGTIIRCDQNGKRL